MKEFELFDESFKKEVIDLIKQGLKKELPAGAVYSASKKPPEGAKEFTTDRGTKYWVPSKTKEEDSKANTEEPKANLDLVFDEIFEDYGRELKESVKKTNPKFYQSIVTKVPKMSDAGLDKQIKISDRNATKYKYGSNTYNAHTLAEKMSSAEKERRNRGRTEEENARSYAEENTPKRVASPTLNEGRNKWAEFESIDDKKKAVQGYVDLIQSKVRDGYDKDVPEDKQNKVTVKFNKNLDKVMIMNERNKYDTHSYIDMNTGDVWKGTWKSRTPNGIRTNVMSSDVTDKVDSGGPKSIAAPSRFLDEIENYDERTAYEETDFGPKPIPPSKRKKIRR